jgi:C1A family cysteine protease
MRRLGFISGIIILLIAVMPVSDNLPAQAAEPPVPQEAPRLPPSQPPPPVIDGHGTGFIAPAMDLSHISGQRMPDGSMVGESPVAAPPASFDWRTQNKVTSVKNQGACGSCYAFAALANIESKLLIDMNTTPPGPDYSENNAKECNWRELNNYGCPAQCWGSCAGGDYRMLASLFSQKGIVLESDDPYVATDVACNSSCPYNKTLLDWRIVSTSSVPDTNVLKNYIMTYGPVYTTVYADSSQGFDGSYDGSYTFNYTKSPAAGTNHAVLIVGWSNSLPPDQQTDLPGDGWIVKNSWGAGWGDNGYFYMHYTAANIGMYSSFMHSWQDYDNNGGIMYYDDDCGDAAWGYSSTTAWGLCNFTPTNNTDATRVEFWTWDATTDVDIYIYDDFDGSSLGNLLVSQLNYNFTEAGYHSVALNSPLPLTSGDDVIVVVKFTNSASLYPVTADPNGPSVTGRTYISSSGANGSWYDLGLNKNDDVAIRLRTLEVVPSYILTMAVNGNGTTTPAVGGHAYTAGTVVNINATPDSGWQFVNWTTANMSEIANATAASTTVTVDENKTVTANFAEVTGATLVGHVDLQARPDPPDQQWVTNLTMRFFRGGNETTWSPVNVTTDEYGNFSYCSFPGGTYDIGVKCPLTASRLKSGVVLAGNTTVDFGTLLSGDVNDGVGEDPDYISLVDYIKAMTAYDSVLIAGNWNAACDFNCDSYIGLDDYTLVVTNYDTLGEMYGM